MTDPPLPPPGQTSEKLTKLYRGYKGIYYMVFCGLGAFIGLSLLAMLFGDMFLKNNNNIVMISFFLGIIAMFFFSIRSGMDVAFGKGWSKSLGVFLGVNAPCFCMLGCIVIHYFAISEMKKYGIVYRIFLGINGGQVRAVTAQLVAMESRSPAERAHYEELAKSAYKTQADASNPGSKKVPYSKEQIRNGRRNKK